MRSFRRRLVTLSCALALSLSLLTSCNATDAQVRFFIDRAIEEGLLTPSQAQFAALALSQFVSSAQPMSAEERYQIGRVVAAALLSIYPPYDNPEVSLYLNRLAQGIALFTGDRRFAGGVRVQALDSLEEHAFSTPGGHILITRGLLRRLASEDELAALLAHEIAHVVLGHGIETLMNARMSELVTRYASLSAAVAANPESEAAIRLFSALVADITTFYAMQGYSQVMEFEADELAIVILRRAGYSPSALLALIQRLNPSVSGSAADAANYSMLHPLPDQRIARIAGILAVPRQGETPGDRLPRLLLEDRASKDGSGNIRNIGMDWESVREDLLEGLPAIPPERLTQLAARRQERFEAMRSLW